MGKVIKKVGNAIGLGTDEQVFEADAEAGELKQNALKTSRFQQFALDRLKEDAGADVQGLARLGAQREISGLQTGVEDLRRQQQGQLARRGLGATSLGTGALAGAQQNVARQSASIRASIPERVAQLRRQRTQALLQGATGVSASQNVPLRFNRSTNQRGGFTRQLALAAAPGAAKAVAGGA